MQILEEHELNSPICKKIAKHLEDQLADLRERNDADLSEKDTASLRGEIKEVKRQMNLVARGDPALNEGSAAMQVEGADDAS